MLHDIPRWEQYIYIYIQNSHPSHAKYLGDLNNNVCVYIAIFSQLASKQRWLMFSNHRAHPLTHLLFNKMAAKLQMKLLINFHEYELLSISLRLYFFSLGCDWWGGIID